LAGRGTSRQQILHGAGDLDGEILANRGQRQPTALPFKQDHAKPPFQQPNLKPHRRRGDRQRKGCGRKTGKPRTRLKCAQLAPRQAGIIIGHEANMAQIMLAANKDYARDVPTILAQGWRRKGTSYA
jgi:hypothetical protein